MNLNVTNFDARHERVKEIEYLGDIIDEKLSFKANCDFVCKKKVNFYRDNLNAHKIVLRSCSYLTNKSIRFKPRQDKINVLLFVSK